MIKTILFNKNKEFLDGVRNKYELSVGQCVVELVVNSCNCENH